MMPPSPRSLGVPGVLIGLAALLAGSFLPWLQSGSAARNSFAAAGIARQMLDLPPVFTVALAVWPFAGLGCAAAGALALLRVRRLAAGLSVGLGAWALLLVGLVAAHVRGGGLVHLDLAGPVVTGVGALLALGGAALLAGPRRVAPSPVTTLGTGSPVLVPPPAPWRTP